MSEPIKQHYIPISYLNKFAELDNEKHYIHAYQKKSKRLIRVRPKTICFKKNLYTIPTDETSKKYAIEYFYAQNVDRVYPEIYKVLVDEKQKIIDFETRLKIINTALSFYFRTPKFLNLQNNMTEKMIRDIAGMTDEEVVSYKFLGNEISFNKNEIDSIIKERKENNRILFLSEHLRAYEKLVQQKLMDGICVYKIIDDSEFITSDNPLVMRPYMNPLDPNFDYEILNKPINPFALGNMMHLPLDRKHILTIMPSAEPSIVNTIQRLEIDGIHSLLYNFDVENFSDDWLLGSEHGIEQHHLNQKSNNEETPENIKKIEDFQEMVTENFKLMRLMEQYGVGHEKTLAKLNEMKKNPKVVADPNFKKLVEGIENAIKEKKTNTDKTN